MCHVPSCPPCRQLAELEEEEGLLLTPFERNLEVWRQLWRVLERSDIVVQVCGGLAGLALWRVLLLWHACTCSVFCLMRACGHVCAVPGTSRRSALLPSCTRWREACQQAPGVACCLKRPQCSVEGSTQRHHTRGKSHQTGIPTKLAVACCGVLCPRRWLMHATL